MIRASVLLALLLVLCGAAKADEVKPIVVDVWPGKAPGETGEGGEEKDLTRKGGVKIIGNIHRPTLTIHRPASGKDTGTAVVICPGGGYSILAIDHEGKQVATWLNSIGVTGIVLKYRVSHAGRKGPLQDAQRALSLVRSRAKEWGVDPHRIGILGFSAGGHLSANASINFDKREYEEVDEIDKTSCRPDFTVLIYPAYLATKDVQLVPEMRVSKESPPTFFVHAADDGIGPDNSIVLFQALRRAGVPAEMHIFGGGGHGFGMNRGSQPVSAWPARCEEWLRSRGLLAQAKR